MSVCNFNCSRDCSEWCCGGATLITLEEIGKCYDVFPITVGFRKYPAMDEEHAAFLEAVGFRNGRGFIVGDFIAGNRYRDRCVSLDADNLCMLQREGRKPLQCRIVPFCAIYPEDRQGTIFNEQKEGKFSKCKGYRTSDETNHRVWEKGRFTDHMYKEAFSGYRAGLIKQRPVMQKILEGLMTQPSWQEFLKGDGILETHIPMDLLFEVLEASGVPANRYHLFINAQGKLCYDELVSGADENPVMEDYLEALNKVAKSYAEFTGR